jgi:uncharacterized protein
VAVEKQITPLSQTLAERHTILRCEVGSTVHGLGVAGTDDRDELGVCIEPQEYVIGLQHFEQYVHRSKPMGVRSEAGDLDLTIYGLRKFASLALKGNPSILLLFNVPDEKCMVITGLGRELRNHSSSFASKKAGAAFLGYMQQQRQRLMGERGQMNVKRPELIERYGFDTKYAGHIIRLGFQGIDYMDTGAFPIPMPEEQRNYILAVRTGEIGQNEVLTKAGQLEAELKHAIDSTLLPDQPDYESVNGFLVAAYQRTWQWGAQGTDFRVR